MADAEEGLERRGPVVLGAGPLVPIGRHGELDVAADDGPPPEARPGPLAGVEVGGPPRLDLEGRATQVPGREGLAPPGSLGREVGVADGQGPGAPVPRQRHVAAVLAMDVGPVTGAASGLHDADDARFAEVVGAQAELAGGAGDRERVLPPRPQLAFDGDRAPQDGRGGHLEDPSDRPGPRVAPAPVRGLSRGSSVPRRRRDRAQVGLDAEDAAVRDVREGLCGE